MKTMTELVMELFPLWSPVECDLALPKSDNEDDFVREFSIDGVEVYRLQVYYLLYVQESSEDLLWKLLFGAILRYWRHIFLSHFALHFDAISLRPLSATAIFTESSDGDF